MLTIKRRCIAAQAMFDLVDENGEWQGEVPSPRFLVTASQEKQMPFLVDKLLEQVCEELNAKGQVVRMGSGRWQVSGGLDGREASLQEGSTGIGIRRLPGQAGADKESGDAECSSPEAEPTDWDGS